MVAFNYSQTFLITATINYLEKPLEQHIIDHANGLIGAAVLIYSGIAVSGFRTMSTKLIDTKASHGEL